MNTMNSHRGAAPVGFVTELEPLEAGVVRYFRLWCKGPSAQAQIWNEFARALGPAQGRKALNSFEILFELCVRHSRRPLIRHDVQCKCLGADESCFANFVSYACDGEHEDALLIATTIVRPDMAPQLVGLAQEFGIAMRMMTIAADAATPTTTTLH